MKPLVGVRDSSRTPAKGFNVMAKIRYINSKFWSDGWVRKLNPLDRYLFLYFITNEHVNVSGIYELPIETMAFESGIDREELLHSMLPRMAPKVLYKDGWVVIVNFPKNQNLKSDDLLKGIWREFDSVPKNIQILAEGGGWGEGLGRVPHTKTILNLTKTKPIGEEISQSFSEIPQTLEEFLESKGYHKDSIVDSDGNASEWWEDQDGTKLRKGELTTLQGAYKRLQGHPTGRPQRATDHFDHDTWLKQLKDSSRKEDKIIALIWKEKGYHFDNYQQWRAQMDMDGVYAKKLVGYSGAQVAAAIDRCRKESKEKGYEWKASTVAKKIAEITI